MSRKGRIGIPVWLIGGMLALLGCSSRSPVPAESFVHKEARLLEQEGVRSFERGRYDGALQHFERAIRMYQGLDDERGVIRNQLHSAEAELRLRRPQDALLRLDGKGDRAERRAFLILQAQANLALGRLDATGASLAAVESECATDCLERGSLLVLQARLALRRDAPGAASKKAQEAIAWLQGKNEEAEMANAWRLLAESALGLKDKVTALNAAHRALEIDRRLGQAEKIARNWILQGNIHRGHDRGAAIAAYQQALKICRSADLADLEKEVINIMAESNL